MLDRDIWREVLQTLQRNPVRTYLTAWGVSWGVLILIFMLAFVSSLEGGVKQNMRGWGTKQVFPWGGRTSMSYQGMRPGRRVRYTEEDIPIVRSIPGIKHLAPRVRLGGWRDSNNVVRGNKVGAFSVMGDFPDIFKIQEIELVEGRVLNPDDVREARKVCVIGEQVHEVLYERGEKVVGSYLKVRGVYFQVVGSFKSLRTGERADRDSQVIHIPFTSFQQAFNSGNDINYFAMVAESDVSPIRLERDVKQALMARHKVHPEDEHALGSHNAAKEAAKVSALFKGMRIFGWIVGIGTLLMGALGVSNIMLIVVKERTKEIGVRKALGATPASIVRQVLLETVALTALAGYAGLAAGVLIVELIADNMPADAPLTQPQTHFDIALIAVGALILCGCIAGLVPARHAVRIRPIEALRTE